MFVIFYGHKPTQSERSESPRNIVEFPLLKIVKMHLSKRIRNQLAAMILSVGVPALGDSPSVDKSDLSGKMQSDHSSSADNFILGGDGEKEASYYLYRDLTRNQSDLAHLALKQAYSANLKRSRKTIESLRSLEAAGKLPPLSELLSVAVDVMRYQNGDFQDEDEERALLKSIDDASEQGSYLCKRALEKEPDHPTYLLILGGLRGFSATLKIHGNPSQAMSDGFQALKLLERSRSRDSRVKDSYMGTGIFNCTAANAPLFVRATLKIIGRSVSMKTGLEGLRVSAYKGQYTSVSSQLFLIQFLTPYEKELAREKREIFRSLETSFPRNPYYTFLKIDEALCFYPDSFYTHASRTALASRIHAFGSSDFASRRYGNLVRYQYTLLDPTPDRRMAPDTSFLFRDYGFYPAFIEALRYKRATEDTLGTGEKPPKAAQAAIKEMTADCIREISDSPMNPTRRRYYVWHVTDALRWSTGSGRAAPTGSATTSR